MGRPLVINDDVRAEIKRVIAYAEANPLSWETLRKAGTMETGTTTLALKDRDASFERPPSAHVYIPFGYRAALSIEDQPGGLCKHLSVSAERPGRIPNQPALLMVAEEFGMKPPFHAVWLEEFEPGHHAINVLTLVEPRKAGNA